MPNIDEGVDANGEGVYLDSYQTQTRGTNSNEYEIYCSFSDDKPLKTFDEWLNS